MALQGEDPPGRGDVGRDGVVPRRSVARQDRRRCGCRDGGHRSNRRGGGRDRLLGAARVRRLAQLLALGTGADDVADRLLDAAPVVLFGNGGRRLVDAAVVHDVHVAGNLVLPRRVRDDLLVLEHELVPVQQLVMRGGAAQAALLRAVGAVGILAVLEVVLDLVEALLAHQLLGLAGGQVPAVDDGVDEAVRIALEVAAALDAADALEAQRIPDLARRHVGLVDEVEDAVRVAQPRRPVDICLAHEAAGSAVSGRVGDEEAAVAHMAAAARVVGPDVEAAQALLGPVLAVQQLVGALDVAQQHDGAKVLEPKVGEAVGAEGVHQGVRVAAVNLLVDLGAQVDDERHGDLVARCKGHNGRHRLAVPQRHLARHNVRRQNRVVRVRKRRLAGDPMDCGAGRVIDGGRHRLG